MHIQHNKSLALFACLATAIGASNGAFANDLQGVQVSGHDKIYVDTDYNGPDSGDPYFTTYYDSAGNCYLTQGTGVQPDGNNAFPFVAGQSESQILETGTCGGMNNMRYPDEHLTANMSSDNTNGLGNAGIAGILDAGACGGGLPGGNGNSAGKLVDSTDNGVYDSVCGMQTSGVPFLLDIDNLLYTPSGSNAPTGVPAFFKIPYAGLKLSGSSYVGRYNIYVPLLAGADAPAANATAGANVLGTFDLTEGVRIGNSGPFNVMTLLRLFVPFAPEPVPAIGPWSILLLMSGILLVTVFGFRRSHSV